MSGEAIVQNYLDDSRSAMRAYKKLAEKAIAQLKDEELHTIVQAINRQLMHYAYHIGQIVYLAKHFRSAEWTSLSIPRNRSAEFNAYLSAQNK